MSKFVCKYPYRYDDWLGENYVLPKGSVVTIVGVSNDMVHASATNQVITHLGETQIEEDEIMISIITFKEFFEEV